ncbi:MAG: beta-RFAP synthase [Planctomycetales bacterium]|nr:beta-RFAP synthase [Planctomycetales bacterium]NIM08725.1 beta-RFAP synthase [Planctomycetales bacterium]NIN08195.1 beta-RFAP synthase [Planctomycetales bacterium]NIN77323.1 beta-RFAP synthase [Planctomycetales bacterium]NIO34507.1 beta-RFAP synthase [Planctomycetales bacterium]
MKLPADPCSTATVEVTAPSRLHFGLLSFGARHDAPFGAQFGGVGTMIDQPGVRLVVQPAAQFEVVGPHHQRARQIALQCLARLAQPAPPPCRLQVLSAGPQHVGLGTGTQLALAVCSGLLGFLGHPPPTPAELADWTGRGQRSSIGTHGFCRGGLLYEERKPAGQRLAPLEAHVRLPAEWRWLLVRPKTQSGLHGSEETGAFDRLPAVPDETVDQLRREVREHMLPAARASDLASFGKSIFRYGITAGNCFATRQSAGPFATPRLAQLVDQLRANGICGVGQSSWGPTIFALCANQTEAEHHLQQLTRHSANGDLDCLIAAPNHGGATIQVRP